MITVDICSPGGAFSPAAVGDGVTDDAPAFRAFNDWAVVQSDSITLTLGSGAKRFLFNSADSDDVRQNFVCHNVPQNVTVIGNGPTTSVFVAGVGQPGFGSGVFKNAHSGFGSTNRWTARVDSVSAGATSVICKTPAETAQFSTNTWAMMSGLDMQGAGQPVNPFFFEYVYITAINAGTGEITFQSPLENSYLDDWPEFYQGPAGDIDAGGPATLYALHAFGTGSISWQSCGIEGGGGQSYPRGLSVSFTDFKATDVQIVPTMNGTITFTNCDVAEGAEFDKCVSNAIYDNTICGQMDFQSSNNQVTFRNGSIVTILNGTPRFLTITDSKVSTIMRMGATFGGRTETFTTSGSTIAACNFNPVQDEGEDDTGVGNSYTMTGSTITITKSGHQYGCRWAIPGTNCYFGAHNDVSLMSPQFKVLSVTDNGTTFDVLTNYTGGSFPVGKPAIRVMPYTSVSVAANTVSSDEQILAFRGPYSKRIRLLAR